MQGRPVPGERPRERTAARVAPESSESARVPPRRSPPIAHATRRAMCDRETRSAPRAARAEAFRAPGAPEVVPALRSVLHRRSRTPKLRPRHPRRLCSARSLGRKPARRTLFGARLLGAREEGQPQAEHGAGAANRALREIRRSRGHAERSLGRRATTSRRGGEGRTLAGEGAPRSRGPRTARAQRRARARPAGMRAEGAGVGRRAEGTGAAAVAVDFAPGRTRGRGFPPLFLVLSLRRSRAQWKRSQNGPTERRPGETRKDGVRPEAGNETGSRGGGEEREARKEMRKRGKRGVRRGEEWVQSRAKGCAAASAGVLDGRGG